MDPLYVTLVIAVLFADLPAQALGCGYETQPIEFGGMELVGEAENGKQALKLDRELKPDVILMDLMMPEMDGFEFRRAIVEDQRTAYIPFIFLTSKND